MQESLIMPANPLSDMKFTNVCQTILSIIIIVMLIVVSCKTNKKPSASAKETKKETIMTPSVIIYKTRKDYADYVPIGLSADKKTITSYPDKTDIYYKVELATPTRLVNGFLLDNRGVNLNSAFLDYTYNEYSKLAETPTVEILLKHILDKEPFTEMYSCKCSRDTAELNRLIKEYLAEAFIKLK